MVFGPLVIPFMPRLWAQGFRLQASGIQDFTSFQASLYGVQGSEFSICCFRRCPTSLSPPPPPTSLRSQASNKSGSRSSTAPTHVVLTEIMLESTTSDTCGARSSFCYAVPCCAGAKSASRVLQSIRPGLEHDHHSLHKVPPNTPKGNM